MRERQRARERETETEGERARGEGGGRRNDFRENNTEQRQPRVSLQLAAHDLPLRMIVNRRARPCVRLFLRMAVEKHERARAPVLRAC
eukprot:4761511-Pleurochrysis_carterae.AAC.1